MRLAWKSARIAWIPALGALLSVACADHVVLAPGDTETETDRVVPYWSGVELARIDCRVSTISRTMTCGEPSAVGLADNAAAAEHHAVIGGQHRFARLRHAVFLGDPLEAGTFELKVSVQTLTLLPWGTDGENIDEDGVRVFFVRDPTNAVSVTPHGTGFFTKGEPQAYFEYTGVLDLGPDQVLTPSELSNYIDWTFTIPDEPQLTEWEFGVLIAATVPDVNGLTTELVQVSRGSNHTCGRNGAGMAFCWGDNGSGQLGIGETTTSQRTTPAPVKMPNGTTFTDIAAGHGFTCAIGEDERAYSWGDNAQGQIGNGGSGGNVTVPTLVDDPGGVRFTQITAGHDHACAVDDQHRAWCWGGIGSATGKLGHGEDDGGRDVPIQVEGTIAFGSVTASADHTCALDTSGDAYCWGQQSFGRLGNGEFGAGILNTPQTVEMPEGVTFTSIDGGNDHTCAIGSDRRAYCWGNNENGKIGNGMVGPPAFPSHPAHSPAPTPVGDAEHEFTTVAAGNQHTCGVRTNGVVDCWGSNSDGQRGGPGGLVTSPVSVNLIEDYLGAIPTFVEVSAENAAVGSSTCARTTRNVVLCWGSNAVGQIGDGTSLNRNYPAYVAAIRAGP